MNIKRRWRGAAQRSLPSDRLLRVMAEDLHTIVERDPSICTRMEALWHPALPALWTHRIAHILHHRGLRLTARAMMTVARIVTSVEIHPGAMVGRRVFIDHGAAVVIGETAVIGDDVTIYHQVTLGAVGWWQDNRRAPGERRHPVVGSQVVLGANATVLGAVTVGDGAMIGAQALVISDVPAGARALASVANVGPPYQPRPAVMHAPPNAGLPVRDGRNDMDSATTLLLVGATDVMVEKAKAAGLRVLVMQHPERIAEAPCADADLVRIVDYTDLAAVERAARELHDSPGFTAAVSLMEPGLEGAGLVNDMFGLGGTGLEVVRRMRDKLAMRRELAESGLGTVDAAPLKTRADFDAFAKRHGYPFIVKPVDGTASYGVVRVDGPDAADVVLENVAVMRGHRMDRGSIPLAIGDFLMEQYVEGPEFSLECFSFAGRHVVVSVTEKFVSSNHFAELGHAMPARLDDSTEAGLRETGCRFLDAMGLRDGPSHIEVRLSERGPVVIEAHNRIGGDLIADLVQAAYELDLVSYAICWPFRLMPELPDVPTAYRAACTLALVGFPGQVESITGVPEALAKPDVLAVHMRTKPGDAVQAVKDNWDRLCLLAVMGSDTTAAVRRGEELLRDIVLIQVRGTDGVIRPAHVAALSAGRLPIAATV